MVEMDDFGCWIELPMAQGCVLKVRADLPSPAPVAMVRAVVEALMHLEEELQRIAERRQRDEVSERSVDGRGVEAVAAALRRRGDGFFGY